MNKAQKRRCLEITLKLMKKPAARLFLKPIDVISSGLTDYYSIISDPQDFSSIEQRLRQSEYRSIREWKRDMNLIWQNCYTYNGPDSYPSVLARYLQQKFEKELKTFSLLTNQGWLEKVFELREQLVENSSNLPKFLEKDAPLEMLARKDYQPFSPEDYVYLFKSLSSLPEQAQKKLKDDLDLSHFPKDEIDLTYFPLPKLIQAQSIVNNKTSDVLQHN